MSVALQIRDVPETLRDVLAAQAAARGQSLQAYLLDVVTREASFGSKVDMFWRTEQFRVAITDEFDPVAIIRQGRDGGFEIDRHELDG